MDVCRPDGSEGIVLIHLKCLPNGLMSVTVSETSSRKSYGVDEQQTVGVDHHDMRTSPKQTHDPIGI